MRLVAGLSAKLVAWPPSVGVPASAGTFVMASGIVSAALLLDGARLLARVLLVIAALVWAAAALGLARLAVATRLGILRRVRSAGTLSAVASTAVLASDITAQGADAAAAALLGLAVCLWLALAAQVLARLPKRTEGDALLLAVSTEALAAAAAALAGREHAAWLLAASYAPWLLGLALYLHIMSRFAWRELARSSGEHWITGGALAIAALAGGEAALAERSMRAGGAPGLLRTACIVLWACAIAWLPLLLASELRWPRLGFDPRRWSTVFPAGMYAVCSFVAGHAAHSRALLEIARTLTWPAVALWALLLGATLRRVLRGPRQGATAR